MAVGGTAEPTGRTGCAWLVYFRHIREMRLHPHLQCSVLGLVERVGALVQPDSWGGGDVCACVLHC